jgi:hypothetical protein
VSFYNRTDKDGLTTKSREVHDILPGSSYEKRTKTRERRGDVKSLETEREKEQYDADGNSVTTTNGTRTVQANDGRTLTSTRNSVQTTTRSGEGPGYTSAEITTERVSHSRDGAPVYAERKVDLTTDTGRQTVSLQKSGERPNWVGTTYRPFIK